MKIPKNFKREKWIHLGYIVAFTMLVALGALLWSVKEIRELKLSLLDAEWSLNECQHSEEIWRSQIESGRVVIKKKQGDKEWIERWEMKTTPETGDWVGNW